MSKVRKVLYFNSLIITFVCVILLAMSANDDASPAFIGCLCAIAFGACAISVILNNPYVFIRQITAIICTVLVAVPITTFGRDVRAYKKSHQYSIFRMYNVYLRAYDKVTNYIVYRGNIAETLGSED